jgi:PAS domain S-box-containing protein
MVKLARQDFAATAHPELTAIVEWTHDAIIGLTVRGVVSSWNPAATRLYGYAPEEMIGFPANVLYPPGRHGQEAEILRRAAGGEQVRQHRTQRRRKDGAVIAVSVTALPVAGAVGELVSAATASREPGGVAQDVSELLTAILSYVTLACEQLGAATESDWAQCCESASSDLGQIRRAGEKAARLTRQLLACTRREVD